MKRNTRLIIVATRAILTALIYLAVLILCQFGILPESETDNRLFVTGYWFMPLPAVGLIAGILLQVFSVKCGKNGNHDKENRA